MILNILKQNKRPPFISPLIKGGYRVLVSLSQLNKKTGVIQIRLNYFLIFLILFFSITMGQNLIESIDFRGNKKFNKQTLVKWAGLDEGTIWYSGMLHSANKKLVRNLNEKGYLYARIDSVVIKRLDNADRISLVWYLTEELPFSLGEINMEGDSLYLENIEEEINLKEGEIYSEQKLTAELERINLYLANQGYPFAEIHISDISIEKQEKNYRVNLHLIIDSKRLIRIDKFILKGNKATRDNVIFREIAMKEGDLYNQKKIDQIPQALNHLGFFKNVSVPVFAYQQNGKTALIIEIEEGNVTTFDGVIGYIPEEQGEKKVKGYFNGLIQLYFRNLFGTGRKFEVNWKKPDRYSEEFKLYYEEPWIFHFPLNLGLGLERIVRDTTYIEQSYFLNGAVRLTGNFRTTFAITQRNIIPDSIMSRNLQLTRNKTVSTSIGIDYDTRDYPVNPRIGILYRTTYSYGIKKNTGPDYLLKGDMVPENEEIQKVNIEMSYFLNIRRNQVLYFNIQGASIKGNKNRLQLTDHIWFGGARSLRGYRENQFHGTTVAWTNLEYRFIISRDSRIFIFNDWGFYSRKDKNKLQEEILPGYGAGVRFNTPLGVLGIDYGLGRGDTFSTAKVHFGIINTF
jgi:outer membrane protein insertion porin family